MGKASTPPGATVNDQQEIYCQHYAVTLDVVKAAEAAGYVPHYGHELRKLPHIADRIAEIQKGAGVKMIVTQGKVIRETAYLAYSDITDTLGCTSVNDLKQLPENVRKAIKSVKFTRTPVFRYTDGDRAPQRVTAPSGAMSESDQNCQDVTKPAFVVVYEETLHIEMHPKVEPLKLLALISGAVTNPEDRNLLQRPAFTGMNIKTVPPGERPKTEQKDNDEP